MVFSAGQPLLRDNERSRRSSSFSLTARRRFAFSGGSLFGSTSIVPVEESGLSGSVAAARFSFDLVTGA